MSITQPHDAHLFMLGQCHALALALGEHLGEVEYIAVWLDPRGEEALEDVDLSQPYERGPAPRPDLTQHILVLVDGEVIDAAGRTPLAQMDEYCFDSIVGWASKDMPLVRYTVVDQAWVEALAEAWRAPDMLAARLAAPHFATQVNTDYAAGGARG